MAVPPKIFMFHFVPPPQTKTKFGSRTAYVRLHYYHIESIIIRVVTDVNCSDIAQSKAQ